VSPDVELQARRLQELARTFPRALAAQANGTALLALGDPDGAIQVLQSAADVDDPRVHIDLSAALLERWRQHGDRNAAEAAKRAAEMVLARDPSNAQAVFNLALAAEALGQRDEAIKAWSRYASLDPSSKWAAEARARAKTLAETKR
jgi:tetratricopeptide (TPR) repeat protein